jgi:molecular chaperone DnaJ
VGKGHVNEIGSIPGDLFLKIKVKSDKKFSKEGFDLVTEETVHFTTAVLGGTVSINTIHGKKEIKIDPGL